MTERVLTLNAGSSSLKASLYESAGSDLRELFDMTLESRRTSAHESIARVFEQLTAKHPAEIGTVAHRIVHGGAEFSRPVRVDDVVLARLEQLRPLAPLHLPPGLEILRAALERLPGAAHVACFDTAFHERLPDVARRLALPEPLDAAGVRRYGFHGLSYEYVLSSLGEPAPPRLIVAHLGSGSSLAAVRDGRSVDTSMSFTPSGGIPMGTRAGDLDPGVLLYLLRERKLTAEQLEHVVDHESGLMGVGGSADMAQLIERTRSNDARARAAVELFAYAIKKQIGAYVAALGGLDALVFTGGIGEHAAPVRALACDGLAYAGVELDLRLNAMNAPVISLSGARCSVRVVKTRESIVMARAALKLAH